MSLAYSGGKNYTIKRHGMDKFWHGYLASIPAKRFVDVFCGGGAVSAHIAQTRPDLALVCNDLHPAAIAVLRGASQEGFIPPATLPEAEFDVLRARAAMGEMSPLIGFAGFGCTHGSVYFSGYARPHKSQRDKSAAAAVSLMRDAQHLARADFHNLDYTALPNVVDVRPGDVWYADKPYEGTTGYKGVPKFDHPRFWRWATELSEIVPVLVSEFAAPAGWKKIWSCTRKLESRGGTREDCVFVADRT
jgi:site-specific DNA-adenine methylase